MRKVVIMGAGGRDFHDFNTVFRDDPDVAGRRVHRRPDPRHRRPPLSAVARRAALPGRHPDPPRGASWPTLIARPSRSTRSCFAYSDLSHADVMHKASIVARRRRRLPLARPAGDDAARSAAGHRGVRGAHRLRQEPDQPARRRSSCSTPGCGRARAPPDALRRPRAHAGAALRHARRHRRRRPDARGARGVRAAASAMGIVVYAGVDYAADPRARPRRKPTSSSGTAATTTSRSIVPDLLITVVDPLRPGHELALPPRRDQPADGRRRRRQQDRLPPIRDVGAAVVANVRSGEPARPLIVRAASPVTLDAGPVTGRPAVLVIEDGPTHHPRRHAVRRGHRRRPAGRGRPSSSTRGRTPSARSPRRIATYPGHRPGAARDGLRRARSSPSWARPSGQSSATSS